MSTTTTNYGLVKPELTDVADITAMNPNWDIIDAELGSIGETVEEALANISTDLSTATGVLPIEHGGTGATTAEGARTNLETNLKTYTSLEQIGLSAGSETIEQISDALQNGSMLIYTTSNSNNKAIYPSGVLGVCVIQYSGASRNDFSFTSTTGRKWFATYYKSNAIWTGWKEIFTTDRITKGTTDIGASSALTTDCIHLVYE